MAVTMIKKSQITEFAEHVYAEQKDFFVKNFSHYLMSRIESGQTQFKNGEYMSLMESKDRLYQEFFNKNLK